MLLGVDFTKNDSSIKLNCIVTHELIILNARTPQFGNTYDIKVLIALHEQGF